MNRNLRINEILISQGKTLTDLAKMVNMTRGNLSVSLEKNPRLDLLQRIAMVLDASIFELFKPNNCLFGFIRLESAGVTKDYPISDLPSLRKAIKDIENLSMLSDESPVINLIDRLIEILQEKRLTLDDFLKIYGSTKQNLLRAIGSNPQLSTILSLSEKLGVEIGNLFEQKDYPVLKGLISLNGDQFNIASINDLKHIKKIVKRKTKSEQTLERINEIINEVLADYNEHDVNSLPLTMDELRLDQVSVYDTSKVNCWSFCHNHDTKNGIELNLGNMVNGYEFSMFGQSFVNSECAYIAGYYSSEGEACLNVQKQLSTFRNGLKAKRVFRNTKNETTALIREEWPNFEFMKLVIWSKIQSNDRFRKMLISIPANAIIIEDSTAQKGPTKEVWGASNFELIEARKQYAKKVVERIKQEGISTEARVKYATQRVNCSINNIGIWSGQNAMGKILMLCKIALENNTEPNIDYELLRSKKIFWFGEILKF